MDLCWPNRLCGPKPVLLPFVVAVGLAAPALCGAQTNDELRRMLQSGDRDTVIRALDAVYAGKIEPLYPAVLAAFRATDDGYIRRKAVYTLQRRGSPLTAAAVAEAVDDAKAEFGSRHLGSRELAVQNILLTGDDVLIRRTIEEALADPELYYRKLGAAVLARHPATQLRLPEAVAAVARDPNPVIRYTFFGHLRWAPETASLVMPLVIEAIRSPDAASRIPAAWALVRDRAWPEQQPDVCAGLIAAMSAELAQPELARSGAAGTALVLWKDWPGVEAAVRVTLEADDLHARAMAATALVQMEREFDVLALQPVIQGGGEDDQLRAVGLLGEVRDLKGLPILSAALGSRFGSVRQAAVFAARSIGLVGEFREVGEKSSGTRVGTLVAKRELTQEEASRREQAAAVLVTALQNDDLNVGAKAADALARIEARSAVPALKEFAGQLADGFYGDGPRHSPRAWRNAELAIHVLTDADPQAFLLNVDQLSGSSLKRHPWQLNEVHGVRIPTHESPRPIGTQKQLFLDDFVVDRTRGVERVFHPFEKHPDNPVFHAQVPWEENWVDNFMCSVHYDPQQRRFQMWYRCGAGHTLSGYAVSDDGLLWQRPDLGRVEFHGSPHHNLLALDGQIRRDAHRPGHNVVFDPQTQDSARRYASVFDYEGERRGFYASYSPNGIDWSAPQYAQMVYGDVATLIPDPSDGGYLFFPKQMRWVDGYRRSFGFAQLKTIDGYAPRTYPFTALTSQHDALVAKAAAESFGVLARGTLDPSDSGYYSEWHTQIYSVTPLVYEGHVLGFYDLWYLTGNKEGPLELLMMATRDRDGWFDVGFPQPALARGRLGQWDAGMVYGGSNLLVVEDQIRLYYAGFNLGHWTGKVWAGEPHHTVGIGLATLRLDGFVSLTAKAEGEVLTQPLKFDGQQLEMNAAAADGWVRVEIQGLDGRPVPGFAAAECQPVIGDAVRHPVRWKGDQALKSLAGQPIRLRFLLNNAELYAFQFR